MAFNERINLLINVVADRANTAVGQLKTNLAQADTSFGKMKVASSAAWDGLKQHAAVGALAIGTAIVGFATKAVGDFQKVALGAGQLASSLGITTEEASRLQETADDLGIGVAAVERGIGRMNREIENSPEKFANIGASIQKTKDGTTDVTETFLGVIEALNGIEDPAKRAVAAQGLLGKGWQEMSRIIALGADDLREKLASVEDAKIATPEQVEQAEELRDKADELRGKVESLSLELGQELVPVLTDLADVAIAASGAVGKLKDVMTFGGDSDNMFPTLLTTIVDLYGQLQFHFGVLRDTVTGGGPEITATFVDWADEMDNATGGAEKNVRQMQAMATQQGRVNDVISQGAGTAASYTELERRKAEAIEGTNEKLRESVEAYQASANAQLAATDAGFAMREAQRTQADEIDRLNEMIAANSDANAENNVTQRELEAQYDNVAQATIRASEAEVENTRQAGLAMGVELNHQDALDQTNRSLLGKVATLNGPEKQAVLEHIARINGIPLSKVSEILANTDPANLEEQIGKLNNVSVTRTAAINADVNEQSARNAEARLNQIAREREAHIRILVSKDEQDNTGGSGLMVASGNGTFTSSNIGGFTSSGTGGPEPAPRRPPPGQTDGRGTGTGGGYTTRFPPIVTTQGGEMGTTVINVRAPVIDERTVRRLERLWARRNGS